MNILVDIGHPKHVHTFKNVIAKLMADGHKVKITAKNRNIVLELLDYYDLNYSNIGEYKGRLIQKAFALPLYDLKLLKLAVKFKPDLFLSKGSASAAHVSRLLKKPHITFKDTEHANLADWLTLPFTDVIVTPSCFKKNLNPRKHVKFNGYFELTYLHPKYFKPDPCVLDECGLDKDDKFIILRLVSWSAAHDVKQYGFNKKVLLGCIPKLERYGRVFISSEGTLGSEFEAYRLNVPPEKFHSLLSYAQLYVGEGASIATEAAVLGTPAVLVSSLAELCGNFDELYNYKLVYSFSDSYKAFEKAFEILQDPKSKKKWIRQRDKMLNEKIDVTRFMVNLIENYPECLHDLQR